MICGVKKELDGEGSSQKFFKLLESFKELCKKAEDVAKERLSSIERQIELLKKLREFTEREE